MGIEETIADFLFNRDVTQLSDNLLFQRHENGDWMLHVYVDSSYTRQGHISQEKLQTLVAEICKGVTKLIKHVDKYALPKNITLATSNRFLNKRIIERLLVPICEENEISKILRTDEFGKQTLEIHPKSTSEIKMILNVFLVRYDQQFSSLLDKNS